MATLHDVLAIRARSRAEAEMRRRVIHLELLERYGLTPDTCPVCRLCPILP